jgi:hypothetical protein
MTNTPELQGDARQCNAIRRDGRRCTCPVVLGSGLCFAHDPSRRDDAVAGRQAGGHGRSKTARLQKALSPRVAAICDRIEPLIDELRRGEVDPRVATAMVSVARTIVTLESSVGIEERLRNLLAILGAQEPKITGGGVTGARGQSCSGEAGIADWAA